MRSFFNSQLTSFQAGVGPAVLRTTSASGTASADKALVLRHASKAAYAWIQEWTGKTHGYSPAMTQGARSWERRLRGSMGQSASMVPSSPFAQQSRGMASQSAMAAYDNVDPRLTTLPEGVPPFQLESACAAQAKHIALKTHGLEPVSDNLLTTRTALTPPEKVMPDKWLTLVHSLNCDPRFQTAQIRSADHLLELYQQHGPFVIRGPELDDATQQSAYNVWHAIAIMAVTRVTTSDQTEHIALYAFDCNDQGQDPETRAADKQAEKLNKTKADLTLSDLVNLGCDQRRIRVIDGASMVSFVAARRSEMTSRGQKSQFEALFLGDGKPIFAPEQTEQLAKVIAEHPDEIEIYPQALYQAAYLG